MIRLLVAPNVSIMCPLACSHFTPIAHPCHPSVQVTDIQAIALLGVEIQIAGIKQQMADLLDLFLSRGSRGALVGRENYEVKVQQLNEQLAEVEARAAQIQEKLGTEAIAPELINEAKRLRKIVRVAGPHATFAEKRVLLRFLDIQVFHTCDKLELVGCIPTRNISFQELQ